MKKLCIIILVAVLLSGCINYNWKTGTTTRILTPEQVLSACPSGFTYIANAGNGWYYVSSPIGKFLVSIQGTGEGGTFVQMTWCGKE